MTSKNLLIPNRHLPFGMLITRLLKLLKFDLSAERSIEPSVDINNTLPKRMRARERAPAPQPLLSFLLLPLDPLQPPQPLITHIQLSLLSFVTMIWRWLLILRRLSMAFRTTCNISAHPFATFRRGSTRAIVGTLGLFLFREATRSLFLHLIDTWVPPPAPSEAPAPPEDSNFQEEWPHLCRWQKGGESFWSSLGVLWFYVFVYVLFYLDM